MPAGQVAVRRSGSAVELASCDPGREAAGPAPSGAGGGAEVAMSLLVTRATTYAGALDGGAGEAEADCLATGVLAAFSPTELAAPELPVDFEARQGRLEERCR
jgi:hypothetical protein